MSGVLREIDFSSLEQQHDPDQKTISQYTNGESTIAVVREPSRGIEEVCDEHRPELGMPREALDDYWRLRGAYEDNQYISNRDAANRAFAEANLEDRFDEYVRSNEDAQKSLDELVQRLESGENITLVCFEGDGKRCHRHILKSMIKKRREASLKAEIRPSH